MRLVQVLILMALTAPIVRAQSARQTPAEYRAEIQQTIATFENGDERYREHDNFRRYVDALAAHKLGLSRGQLRDMLAVGAKHGEMRVLASSSVTDISPDTTNESEASIAISRKDTRVLVAGANDLFVMYDSSMPAFVSTDGGHSWNTHYLPIVVDGEVQAYGDPYIVCDDQGMFYYAFLVSSGSVQSPPLSDIMVARSSDGVHWTLGGLVLQNTVAGQADEDKETIAVDCDPESPYHGRVYIAWKHYASGKTTYMIAHSDDRGVTWSKPISRKTKYGYFEQLRVGKGGTVFIASNYRYVDVTNTANDTGMHAMMVSHDGGQTFKEYYFNSYHNYPPPSNQYYPNALKDGIKAYAYTSFDVDPNTNKLYAVYGDYDAINGCAKQFAITSTDEGQSWTAPQRIGATAYLQSDHFQPWVTFDASTGKARVSMYSSEEDMVQNQRVRMVRFDFDDLSNPTKLGESLFDPNEVLNPWAHPFIGDYTGGDAYNGVYAAAWTEQDNMGGGDIMAYVENGTSSVKAPIDSRALTIANVYPNPASTSVNVELTGEGTTLLHLYDLHGREVLSLPFTGSGVQSVDVSRLSAGVYNVTAESMRGTASKQFIVLH